MHLPRMAHVTCIADSWGRLLRKGSGNSVCFVDGVQTGNNSFVLNECESNPDLVYITAASGGHVCFFPGLASFALTDDSSSAQYFESARSSIEQDGHGCSITLRLHSADLSAPMRYLSAKIDGSLTASTEPYAFDLARGTVPGTVTATWALTHMDGQEVTLWTQAKGGASDDSNSHGGWLCAQPITLLGTGGHLTCSVQALGQWEVYKLKVLDTGKKMVALMSCHNRWMCAYGDGRIHCDAKEIGQWERLHLEQVDPRTVSLTSTAHYGGKAAQLCLNKRTGRIEVHPLQTIQAPGSTLQELRLTLMDGKECRRLYDNSRPTFAPKA